MRQQTASKDSKVGLSSPPLVKGNQLALPHHLFSCWRRLSIEQVDVNT